MEFIYQNLDFRLTAHWIHKNSICLHFQKYNYPVNLTSEMLLMFTIPSTVCKWECLNACFILNALYMFPFWIFHLGISYTHKMYMSIHTCSLQHLNIYAYTVWMSVCVPYTTHRHIHTPSKYPCIHTPLHAYLHLHTVTMKYSDLNIRVGL